MEIDIKTIFFLFLFITSDVFSMDVISHRGNCCGAKENSVTAINKAWDAKADAVEVDIQMSKDNVILLFHDRKINGTLISSLTYSEIRVIDSGVPTLSSVLKNKKLTGYYVLDLKDKRKIFLNTLSETIKQTSIPETAFAFQSEDMQSLVYLRERLKESRYIYLSKLKRSFPWFKMPDPVTIREFMITHDIHHISIKGRKFINKDFIDALKRGHNTKVFVWTINEPERALFYAELGVDGVITDKVNEIKRFLDNKN